MCAVDYTEQYDLNKEPFEIFLKRAGP